MKETRILAVALLLSCNNILPTNGWIQNSPFLRNSQAPAVYTASHTRPSTNLFAKLWDRMEIEEDEEPMWYVLNCVAGLEMDLLRQVRQVCDEMEDAEKFVVPTISKTRSHGANRMVTDTKVKYQGYVFAKLRLCPETYEAIQGLDLCRSWMGTVNQKGYKKLPPAPVALNELEIENFGLEDEEYEEEETSYDEENNIIVDTEEEDKAAAAIEEEVQTVYKGLRVEDMIKVTAKNKFFDEDGIVRRLKDGKVMIKFYTYGSMYEEWLDPGDVRKLTSAEVLKGLSGPSQPITQRDIDGPSRRDGYGESRSEMRRNLYDSMGGGGGGQRNRKQDRVANRFSQGDSLQDQNRERRNWNQYKDNERRSRGGAYADGEFDMRGSSAQSNVDAQWGRGPQQNKRDRKRPDKRSSGEDDWSAFVSPVSSTPSKAETDDFFDSLMTDLSKDLDNEDNSGGPTKSGGSDDDDFFASLMSEISDDESAPSSAQTSQSSDDDFFASLEREIDGATDSKPVEPSISSDDDFFASLEKEIEGATNETPNKPRKSKTAGDDLDDFFAEIGAFDNQADVSATSGDADDFFADLEAELEAELSMPSSVAVEEKPKPKKKSSPVAEEAPSSNLNAADLQKCTVPALKDMLRDRGLKVSGKKAELIERLVA